MGLAIGTVAGSLGHLLIQIPGSADEKGPLFAHIDRSRSGRMQVLRLMAPRVLGLSFGQLNHLLIQFLAQSMACWQHPGLGLCLAHHDHAPGHYRSGPGYRRLPDLRDTGGQVGHGRNARNRCRYLALDLLFEPTGRLVC